MSCDPDRVTIHRLYAGAGARVGADATCLVFAPLDVALRSDGHRVAVRTRLGWCALATLDFPEFDDDWDTYCPRDLCGRAPPYLSAGAAPGTVDLWTGICLSVSRRSRLVLSSAPDCAAPAGVELLPASRWLEPDELTPLWLRLRIVTTDMPVTLSRLQPCCELSVVAEGAAGADCVWNEYEGLRPRLDGVAGMAPRDWKALRRHARRAHAPTMQRIHAAPQAMGA